MSLVIKYFYVLFALFLLPCHAVADTANNKFTGADAAVAITSELIKSGAGYDIKTHINEVHDEDTIASAGNSVTAEVDNLNIDKEHSRWKAVLLLKSDGKNLSPLALSGTYDEITSIPVLKRQLGSGDVISLNDIEFIKQPVKFIRKNAVTDTKELVGKSPRHVISQNRPIRQDEISNPAIMLKGAHITMIYKSRNLEIRASGEAMDSGAKGDVVRVKNTTSKSVISGVVESGNIVRITSPDSYSAEAM